LNHLAWDQAAADELDLIDPISTAVATAAPDFSTFSSAPVLDFDYAPLETFAAPLFDYFPSSLPVQPLSSTTSSLTNTPSTGLLQSPSPAPPSPIGPALFPGLKLPPQQQHKSSKPGRRPAGASLSHTADGRITKRLAASASAAEHSPPDDDEDLVLKRYRNNLAAKRYRQKKVDRIQELEDEVRGEAGEGRPEDSVGTTGGRNCGSEGDAQDEVWVRAEGGFEGRGRIR